MGKERVPTAQEPHCYLELEEVGLISNFVHVNTSNCFQNREMKVYFRH